MLVRRLCQNHCTCSTTRTAEAMRGLLCHFVKSRPKCVFEIRSYFEEVVLIWLGSFLPLYSVQMRGRSRGEGNFCLLRFFFLKHTLICEGLERALLRMHRSILTLCICGISSACSLMGGKHILLSVSPHYSQNQFTLILGATFFFFC